jgi:hypothetical protein
MVLAMQTSALDRRTPVTRNEQVGSPTRGKKLTGSDSPSRLRREIFQDE